MGKRPALFIKATLRRLREILLDFFFEQMECPACQCESRGLCPVCQSEIRPWGEFTFEGIRGQAMAHYSGTAKSLLYGFKKQLSFEAMESLFLVMDRYLEQNPLEGYDWIIPVTSVKANRKARGFDPAVLLARHLAQKTGLPLLDCVNNKGKKEHKNMNYSQRLAASRDAFTLRRGGAEKIQGQRILLFDDVMTSGATITAVTKLLQSHGAKEVEFLVLERATA